MQKIRVLLVDDDLSWQGAMGRFLNRENDILLNGMANSKQEAVNFLETIPVDVVLMDINLTENNLDGIEAALEIGNSYNVKIIMLTSIKGDNVVLDSFTAGAVNYISKDNYRKLPDAIREIYNSTAPYELLAKEFSRMKKEEQINMLSPGEKEIYRLMEEGKTRNEMQSVLKKSENTIKKYVKHVINKLDVKNSKEAVEKVNRKGLN